MTVTVTWQPAEVQTEHQNEEERYLSGFKCDMNVNVKVIVCRRASLNAQHMLEADGLQQKRTRSAATLLSSAQRETEATIHRQ